MALPGAGVRLPLRAVPGEELPPLLLLHLVPGEAAPVGQGGAHKHPAHQLHGAEDVGQAEEDVVDLLLQPELAQLGQDVVEGDLFAPGDGGGGGGSVVAVAIW